MLVGFFVSASQGYRGIYPTYAKLYAHRVRYYSSTYRLLRNYSQARLPCTSYSFIDNFALYIISTFMS